MHWSWVVTLTLLHEVGVQKIEMLRGKAAILVTFYRLVCLLRVCLPEKVGAKKHIRVHSMGQFRHLLIGEWTTVAQQVVAGLAVHLFSTGLINHAFLLELLEVDFVVFETLLLFSKVCKAGKLWLTRDCIQTLFLPAEIAGCYNICAGDKI